MKKRFLTIQLLLSLTFISYAQEKMELTSASFHSFTRAKTLGFLKNQNQLSDFLNNMDSVVQIYFKRKLNYPNNFSFIAQSSDSFDFNPGQFNLSRKDFLSYPKTTLFLSFDITEQPLSKDLPIEEIDSAYFNELIKKRNVCVYQLNAKIIRSDASVLLDKHLYVLLARPDNTLFIGVEHPLYNLNPNGLSKFLEKCLPILMDSTNQTELIQITALPAYVPDNFLQNKLRGTVTISTEIKKDFVQFRNKEGLQSIRFQEPEYELIHRKGKKITPLSLEVQNAIKSEKGKDYMYLWQESRDVFKNKNYKLLTIATVAYNPSKPDSPLWVNTKTKLPLVYLKGNFHCFIQNNDTIAYFNIQTQVTDTSKKAYFNQLLNPTDHSTYTITTTQQAFNHEYHYVLKGSLQGTAFQICISGISGSPSIKELFWNNKLVCIAEGYVYPEILSIIDPDISSEKLNQLLLISFSSLF